MKPIFYFVFMISLLFAHQTQSQSRRAEAFESEWTVLGSKKVNWRVERDVLPVGIDEGGFTKLKIKVTGGRVRILSMIVTYGNGTKDEIPLKHVFTRGAESRVIDLRGGKRVIRKITFVYDTQSISRRAKVWVAGRK